MAGLGRRNFQAGEVLTASNVMAYLQDQAVMNFAGTAARGSAIGTAVSEGMVTYLADLNRIDVYDGTVWQEVYTPIASSGKIIQTQHTDKLNSFTSSTTNAYVDVTGLSVTITPKYSTSKILVQYTIGGFSTTGTSVMSTQIVRNSTIIGNGTITSPTASNASFYSGVSSDKWTNLSGKYLDSPATTSAVTYKIQAFSSTAAFGINQFASAAQWGAASSITVMEIAA